MGPATADRTYHSPPKRKADSRARRRPLPLFGSATVDGLRQYQNQPDTGTDRPAYQATPRTVLIRPDFEDLAYGELASRATQWGPPAH